MKTSPPGFVFASCDPPFLEDAQAELIRDDSLPDGFVVTEGHTSALMTLVEHGYVVDRDAPYLRVVRHAH
jgi:hypothetical protein